MLNDSNLGGTLPRFSAKRNLHRVDFFCDAPGAEQVSLIGDFNYWNPVATPMAQQPDGRWMATLELAHGYHEYVFLVDGKPVLSCLVLGVECDSKTVLTVEGLGLDGHLHPLQDAFADLGAAQCGYCTPAILVTAKALLEEHPHANRDQIRAALSGVLCRCTGYLQIFEAVEAAMVKIAEQNAAAK